MSVLGSLQWIAGIAMILGGLAIAASSSIGLVVAAAGLLLTVYAAKRDYDPSRTPLGRIRR